MAGILPRDNGEINARDLMKSHEHEPVKQHIVFDSQSRPKLIFTTYVGAQDGDPCTCDEYVYLNPSSTQIQSRQERHYKWKAAWDSQFIFDPAVSYDPDGDGVI